MFVPPSFRATLRINWKKVKEHRPAYTKTKLVCIYAYSALKFIILFIDFHVLTRHINWNVSDIAFCKIFSPDSSIVFSVSGFIFVSAPFYISAYFVDVI